MGNGSGSQGSGKVSYPAYLETAHSEFIDDAGVDALGTTTNVATAIEAAILANPYDLTINTGAVAYDPSSSIADMNTAIVDLGVMINSYDEETDWASHLRTAKVAIDGDLIETKYIENDVKAYKDLLDDALTMTTLPRFRGGMRDINAVTSSAFAIGVAYIEASSQRDVAKYSKELMLKLNIQRNENATKSAEVMLNYAISVGELKKALAHYTIETNRLEIVANKEESDSNLAIEEAEAKWDLEMLAYMGNAIAAIAGAAAGRELKGPSTMRTAMGGALSGAAAGMMIGGAPGAVVGGIGGLLIGAFG